MTFIKMPDQADRIHAENPDQNRESNRNPQTQTLERHTTDIKTTQRLNATLASRARFTNPAQN
jgi:hypothetical protein